MYSVKIQFFKTFIVPYFNYCLTLLIYFPKATIQRLCNLYYLCLFKLFRFKASNDLIDVNIELEKLTIYSFQNLVFSRLGSFFFNILNRHDSPSNLKTLLSKNLNQSSYNLRSNSKVSNHISTNNHFGELTVNFFFSKFVTIFKIDEFCYNNKIFNQRLNNNINILIKDFLYVFPRFNVKSKDFSYLEILKC